MQPVAFSATKNGRFTGWGGSRGTGDGRPWGLEGEMDEVRVWSREPRLKKSAAACLRRLRERAWFAALWNFDDPADPGRDASTNRIDGKLIGKAQVWRRIFQL
jgi:hypothetical protein